MTVRSLPMACVLVATLTLVLVPGSALALNGHYLHGAGAKHSAMAGAGVAVAGDPLAALYLNPALLAMTPGHHFRFGVEAIQGKPEVSSTVTTPFGPVTGTTEDDTGVSAIPAFGWSRKADGSRLALGFGGLGLAGFASDYPQDPSNPLLAPAPAGFGRVNSEYSYLKVPFAIAYEVSPELAVGGALTLGVAQLSANAAPFAAPDCSSPTDCYFPQANRETAYGYGFQLGLAWRPVDAWSFGLSYQSEQRFDAFEFNSTAANPNLPNFGTARQFEFTVDLPAQIVAGLAWQPNDRWTVALDGKWIGYDGVDGLGTFGFNPDGSIQGFGWDDIVVVALGAELRPTERWALRAGWNQAESPVVEARAFFTTPAPAVFEDHATLGLGLRVDENMSLDLAVYRAFEGEKTGQFVSPAGPVPGTSVTQRNSSDSLVLTFGFDF